MNSFISIGTKELRYYNLVNPLSLFLILFFLVQSSETHCKNLNQGLAFVKSVTSCTSQFSKSHPKKNDSLHPQEITFQISENQGTSIYNEMLWIAIVCINCAIGQIWANRKKATAITTPAEEIKVVQ